jgi:hypothetical protein
MTPGMSIEEYLSSQFYQTIMQLELLRTELNRFFKKHLLPDSVVAVHTSWSAFLYLYTSVVSEVSHLETLPVLGLRDMTHTTSRTSRSPARCADRALWSQRRTGCC